MIARFTKSILLTLMLILGTETAGAVDLSFEPNAAEMLSLPPYCKARFTAPRGSPEWQAWWNRLGKNFQDIHHYCVGMNSMNRYWAARDPKDRSFYLEKAMNNFDYMVNAAQPDFPLRAEVYASRGEALKLQRKTGEAMRDLQQAIELNPALAKAYQQLIDIYSDAAMKDKALETATQGLRYIPASRSLQRRYLELGGKKPFPEPVKQSVQEPAPEPAPAAESPAEESPAEPATEAEPLPDPMSGAEDAPQVQPSEAQPPSERPNPYCRFCP